ncbi:hypothetical protein D770_19090 [Flammeovirgaceae bacterium 311]|nr:hypothetical protein D770_19090 [Flammeovirgaceae bacterium 311]
MLLPLAQHSIPEDFITEGIMLAGSFLIAAISLRLSYVKHRRKGVLLVMLCGFSLLLAGVLAAPTAVLELLMTSSGGSMVALGHYLNWRCSHKNKEAKLPAAETSAAAVTLSAAACR